MTTIFKTGALAVLLLVIACSPQKKEESNDAEAFDKAQKEMGEQVQKVVKQIPAPSEIPFLLMQTGAEFDKSLLHDLSRVSSYTANNNKAALNLGVYATDVTYLSGYKKSQEALNYLTGIRPLADQLALSSSFDQETVQRFESNLTNTDSLAIIVNNAVANAEKHLNGSDRNKIGAMLLAGSFVEGLYIATALIENYPENELPDEAKNLVLIPLVKVVLDQEEPLNDLIELLASVEQDDNTKALLTELRLIQEEYKKLNITEKIEEGRGDLLLKDEALDRLTNQTGKTHDLITS